MILNTIVKNTFISKVLIIAGGTFGAQVIGMLFTPIITRFFSSEEYGAMSLYSSIIAIMVYFATLNLHKALPITDSIDEAKAILKICILNILSVSFFFFLLFSIDNDYILKNFGIGPLVPYKQWIPIGILFISSYEVLLQWLYSMKDYKSITKTKLLQSVSGNLVKFISGYIHLGINGLLAGVIISQSFGTLNLGRTCYNFLFKSKNHSMPLKLVFKKYYRYPCYSLPADLMDSVCNNIPLFILSYLYTSSEVGFYSLANTVINVPVTLTVVSISRVLFAETAYNKDNTSTVLFDICIKSLKYTTFLIAIPSIVIFLYGPELFSFVFSSHWKNAGSYAQIMLLRIIPYCLLLPISRFLEFINYQKMDLLVNFLRVFGLLICFQVIYNYSLNCYDAVILFSVLNMLTYSSLIVIILYLLK